MPERRRKYTPEFKDEAAKMVVETSRPIAEVARSLGVAEATLWNWCARPVMPAPRRLIRTIAKRGHFARRFRDGRRQRTNIVLDFIGLELTGIHPAAGFDSGDLETGRRQR